MAYARTHNVISFSKKLHMPLLPANIHLLIKSKKGGNDFYTILNQNLDKPTSQHKWNKFTILKKKIGKQSTLLLLNFL